MTTKTLKALLKVKPLLFRLPAEDTGNDLDLTIKVLPRKQRIKKDTKTKLHEVYYDNHEVFVNGIGQYDLFGTSLEKQWLRKKDDKWWSKFNKDWRFLLGLDVYPVGIDPETNFVCEYWLPPNNHFRKHTTLPFNKRSKKKQIAQPNKKSRSRRPLPEFTTLSNKTNSELVCVKDLNTGIIDRISKAKAKKLIVQFSHYDYCTKQEWRKFIKPELALDKPMRSVRLENSKYWIKYIGVDEKGNSIEYPNVFTPKEKSAVKLDLFVVRHKKLIQISKPKRSKQKLLPKYDRHAHLQTIVIDPPLENVINGWGTVKQEKFKYKQLVPKYAYLKNSEGQIYKKIFVENIEKDVTFIRDIRTIYKTIITKQYPPEVCEHRRIIKKNMKLLKQQEEERKKNKKTSE